MDRTVVSIVLKIPFRLNEKSKYLLASIRKWKNVTSFNIEMINKAVATKQAGNNNTSRTNVNKIHLFTL